MPSNGLVEKAQTHIADSRLMLAVDVVERAALRGTGPRKRRVSDARAECAIELDPGGLVERVWREAGDDPKPGRQLSSSRHALDSCREVSCGEDGLRVDQNASHIGRETAWKSERVVCVTPDHDDPDVRVGIRGIDGLGRCEGRGGAVERRDRQNTDQRNC